MEILKLIGGHICTLTFRNFQMLNSAVLNNQSNNVSLFFRNEKSLSSNRFYYVFKFVKYRNVKVGGHSDV